MAPLSGRKDTYLAQNLSQLEIHDAEQSPPGTPITLQRVVPNSGKKRKAPDLSRCTAASSHRDRISAIFEDAGRTLCKTPTPRPLQVNARRLRMPFSTISSPKKLVDEANHAADSICNDISPAKENVPPLGQGELSSLTPPQPRTRLQPGSQSPRHIYQPSNNVTTRGCCSVNEHPNREPPGSGLNSPVGNATMNESTSPGEVVYPDLTRSQPILEPTQYHRPTEQRGSGGTVSGIESWLTQIPDEVTPESIHRPDESHFSTYRSEPPLRASRLDLSYPPPISSGESTYQAPTRFPHPLTPCRYLSSPPKRKAPRLSPRKDSSLASPTHEQFEIYEDECSDELVELSPTVEKYRKGRRPKRERCVSYWDDDVLSSIGGKTAGTKEAGSDRQPLREVPELMRAKGFVDGAEHANFDFNMRLNARDA
ncbi:MAG: hypothetical protein Q9226_001516 [Calogaya cf. arnoldii]